MHTAKAVLIFVCFTTSIKSQDTLYARQVIKYLTSEKCFGRGYVKNGLHIAEKYLTAEIKTLKTDPLFGKSFTQTFTHPVNTFPKKCELTINNKLLKPGIDFIPEPSSYSAKGTFRLHKADSVTYIYAESQPNLSVLFKNKLTFSVAKNENNFCGIEIDKNRFGEEPQEIELDIQNKLIPDFKSRNIGCTINGQSPSDSLIVFSAHYDHLGGLGKSTFFPGANDNASGVSVVLNLIKYYKLHPPKYKTLFLFFAGEEAGLLGSKYFVGSNAIDLKKIKFLINLDLLGTGDDGIMVVNGAIHEKEFAALKRINTEQKLVKEIKKRGKAANSDHYWFSEAGVPCFFIYTMGGTKAYHDVFDVEKTLPLTDYVDVFTLITEFVAEL
jgi:aminopeptidase YwaD